MTLGGIIFGMFIGVYAVKAERKINDLRESNNHLKKQIEELKGILAFVKVK